MKSILFLFTASLLLMACSTDDNNGPVETQELKIKKYKNVFLDRDGNPNGQIVEYSFDENGKRTSEHKITDFSDFIWTYNYNDLGQVIKKTISYTGSSERGAEEYFYNSEKKLDKIYIDYDGDAVVEDSLKLTHQANKITIQHYDVGYSKKIFNFNSQGILLSTNSIGDMGIDTEEKIFYDGHYNITELHITTEYFEYSQNISYLNDGEVNPFYNEFKEFYFNIVWRDGGSLSQYPLFFSPSNVTKTTSVGSSSSENFTSQTLYEYNNSGYPLSSETKIDGVLKSRATYEYY